MASNSDLEEQICQEVEELEDDYGILNHHAKGVFDVMAESHVPIYDPLFVRRVEEKEETDIANWEFNYLKDILDSLGYVGKEGFIDTVTSEEADIYKQVLQRSDREVNHGAMLESSQQKAMPGQKIDEEDIGLLGGGQQNYDLEEGEGLAESYSMVD